MLKYFTVKHRTFSMDQSLPLFLHFSLVSALPICWWYRWYQAVNISVNENKFNIGVPRLRWVLPYGLSGLRQTYPEHRWILLTPWVAVGHPYGSDNSKARLHSNTGVLPLGNLFSLGPCLHCRVTSKNSLSVPLSFAFDLLAISFSIKFRLAKELKPMLTFLLAVLPSNQERAVRVHF